MTGRHEARTRRSFGLFGLIARHLRSPGPGVLLAVVALVLSALVSVGSRAEVRASAAAFRDAIAQAPPGLGELNVRLRQDPQRWIGAFPDDSLAQPTPPFPAVADTVSEILGTQASFFATPEMSAESIPVPATRIDEPTWVDEPVMSLRVQLGLDSHVAYVSGSPPGAPNAVRDVTDDLGSRTVPVIPVAISQENAARLDLSVGDLIATGVPSGLAGQVLPRAAVVEVVGVFQPDADADEFFAPAPRALTMGTVPSADGGAKPFISLLVEEAGYAALSDSLYPQPGPGGTSTGLPAPGLEHVWRYRVDTDRLTAADAPSLRGAIARLEGAVTQWPLDVGRPTIHTGLASVLDQFASAQRVGSTLHAFTTLGVLGFGLLTLVLTSLALVTRRTATLRLLAARGGSMAQAGVLLGGEVLVLTMPAAVLGWLLGGVLVRGPIGAGALVLAASVVLAPVLVATLMAGSRVRARGAATAAMAATAATPRWPGAVEILVVLVAGIAVSTALTRGAAAATGTTDWAVATLPMLLAAAGVVVGLRLVSWPLRTASRAAAGGRGYRAMIGLRRAADVSGATRVALTAVAVAVVTVSFLAGTAWTLASGAERAAFRIVGADVRIDASRIDAPELAALRARPGVGVVAPAFTLPDITAHVGTRGDSDPVPAQLLATDPAAYADVVAGTPLALPALPDLSDIADGALPMVASGGLAVGDQGYVTLAGRDIRWRVEALAPTLDRSTATTQAPVLFVDLTALTALVPTTQVTTAYLAATAEAAADLAATDPADDPVALVDDVTSRRAVEASLIGGPLATLLRSGAVIGGIGAVGLTTMVVLVLLAIGAPGRSELLLRLRALGGQRGGGRLISVLEVVPTTVLAILVGLGAAAVSPRLLATSLDLGPLLDAPPTQVAVPVPLLAAVGTATLALVLLALLIADRRAERSDPTVALRRGDST